MKNDIKKDGKAQKSSGMLRIFVCRLFSQIKEKKWAHFFGHSHKPILGNVKLSLFWSCGLWFLRYCQD